MSYKVYKNAYFNEEIFYKVAADVLKDFDNVCLSKSLVSEVAFEYGRAYEKLSQLATSKNVSMEYLNSLVENLNDKFQFYITLVKVDNG